MKAMEIVKRIFHWFVACNPPDDVMFTKRYAPGDASRSRSVDFKYEPRGRN